MLLTKDSYLKRYQYSQGSFGISLSFCPFCKLWLGSLARDYIFVDQLCSSVQHAQFKDEMIFPKEL